MLMKSNCPQQNKDAEYLLKIPLNIFLNFLIIFITINPRAIFYNLLIILKFFYKA